MNNLVEKYVAATNTHDFKNLVPLISENAIYQFTDKTCEGISEIKSYFENAWNIVKEEVYSAKDIRLILSSEDVKIYVYEYHYAGYISEKFSQGSGKATNVFVCEDDSWKLILEHLNTI